ncbi:hypothetical protein CcCBS67573_g09795 [Chytriomyces confervae]|uniref:Tubulin delta chain n=1 Tax=Chytriomyces confervae TaxID=246404 RepID=A0A507DPM9_9FUNG|nr:hypothetical protein CcCBS67573_g09795 [Chytriomyces confervae]
MLLVEVGQCGIQVGQTLVQLLSSDVQLDEILVDTERKTWLSIEQSDRRVVVDAGATGRGNNWAHGYSDDLGAEKTLEAVRKCFESGASSDRNLMLTHRQGFTDISLIIYRMVSDAIFGCSIAGGTGSGLGSRITEEVREAYPKHFIWNCVISPFASGETALQHYNSLLSLSSLQMSSDMISIFSNDVLMGSIAKQHSLYKSKGDSKISISELNQQIALTLAGVLLPTCPILSNGDGDLQYLPMRDFSGLDLIAQVAPMPACKIVSLASSENVINSEMRVGLNKGLTPPVSWDDLASDLLRNMAPASTSLKRSHISSRIYARNALGPEFWSRSDKLLSKVKSKLGPSIVPSPAKDLELVASSKFGKSLKSNNRSLTLISNGSDTIPTLQHLLQRSTDMYESGAYLHWYDRHYRYHHEACRPSKVKEPVSKRASKSGWDSSLPGDMKRVSERGRASLSNEDEEEVDLFPWPCTRRTEKKIWMEADWDVKQLFEEAFYTVEGVLDSYNEFCAI